MASRALRIPASRALRIPASRALRIPASRALRISASRALRIPPPRFFAPPISPRVSIAPRISHRLLKALVRLDDRTQPIAEIYRRLGREADRLRLPRPSYERIRVLLHQARRIRRLRPTTAQVLVEVCSRARPPSAVLDHLSGVGVPQLGPRPP